MEKQKEWKDRQVGCDGRNPLGYGNDVGVEPEEVRIKIGKKDRRHIADDKQCPQPGSLTLDHCLFLYSFHFSSR